MTQGTYPTSADASDQFEAAVKAQYEADVAKEHAAYAAVTRHAQELFAETACIAQQGGDLPYDGMLTSLAEQVIALAGVETRIYLGSMTAASQFKPRTMSPAEKAEYLEKRVARREGRRKAMSSRKVVSVFARDGFQCVYCGERRNLQVDHIQAWSKGGSDDLENLQTLCGPCNSRKGNR